MPLNSTPPVTLHLEDDTAKMGGAGAPMAFRSFTNFFPTNKLTTNLYTRVETPYTIFLFNQSYIIIISSKRKYKEFQCSQIEYGNKGKWGFAGTQNMPFWGNGVSFGSLWFPLLDREMLIRKEMATWG